MTHTPVRSCSIRLLATLLTATFCAAALLHRPAAYPPLTHTPAPVWLAGDDDKGGMGGG